MSAFHFVSDQQEWILIASLHTGETTAQRLCDNSETCLGCADNIYIIEDLGECWWHWWSLLSERIICRNNHLLESIPTDVATFERKVVPNRKRLDWFAVKGETMDLKDLSFHCAMQCERISFQEMRCRSIVNLFSCQLLICKPCPEEMPPHNQKGHQELFCFSLFPLTRKRLFEERTRDQNWHS